MEALRESPNTEDGFLLPGLTEGLVPPLFPPLFPPPLFPPPLFPPPFPPFPEFPGSFGLSFVLVNTKPYPELASPEMLLLNPGTASSVTVY